MRNRALATLALIPLAILTACGGTPPDLTLTEAYVAERSDAGTVVHVTVNARNTTSEPLAMWAIAYTPGGEGTAPGSISRWTQATAPAGGSVAFDLPVVVTSSPSGTSSVSVAGKVAYVPGNRLRELLSELDYPLPTTTFSGTLPVDWSAAPRTVEALRPGTVRTAAITDRGPVKAVDTLPPLKPAQ
jgi:hypothetical protein